MGKKWGLERGENREEKRRHLDTAAFKIETSRAELERAKQAEKDQRERVRFYQDQADKAENEIQKDLEIPQGLFNRKSSLAKAMEQIELLKKSLADKHIIEGENQELRSKVEILTAQNSSLESKNKENENSLLTFRKQYEDECSKNKDIAKFFMERQDIEFTFSFWKQMQKAAVKQEEKRQREMDKKATSEWLVKTLPKPSKPLEEDKEQEKPVLAAPDMDLDKERQRLNQVFSEALRNTSGTVWEHMKQVKKLIEQWEKAQNRDSFERQTLSQLQELPRQNDRGR